MEKIVSLLPNHPQPLWIRLSTTLAVMAVLCVFQYSLYQYAGFAGFFLLLPGIFTCGFLFNRGSGFLATIIGVALAAYISGFAGLKLQVAVPMLLFVIVAFGTALISEALRIALERLAASEKSKDLLYRELAHRTKNNLMSACSLLTLQARAATTPQLAEGLEAASSRMRVMADVHDYLDPGTRAQLVDVRRYLTDVAEKVGHAMRGSRPVAVEVQADDVELPQQKALALAMIVNEAITNSFKYAFPEDRPGRICVTLRTGHDVTICVEDNGVGCAPGVREGLGTRLMQMMGQQLGATMTRDAVSPTGCRVTLRVPKG